MDLGRLKEARARFLAAIKLARKHEEPTSEAFWLVELGVVALAEGRLDDAECYGQAASRIAKSRKRLLTVFRAEWLLHLVLRRQDPAAPDRHRLTYLKKLWARLKNHRGLGPIREFERAVIDPARRKKEAR
jgi:tetratricopeptide (TPR) repeat protein